MRITAMVSVFNEEDIIGEVIENLLDNGLHVVALDNGSTDNSYSICSKLASRSSFSLHRWFPDGLDLEQFALRLYRLAAEQSPEWLVFSDGDEIMETEQRGRSLHQAIEEADAAGHNLMQYNRFDFFMTEKDDPTVQAPVERLRYYSWQGDYNYRAFKYVPGIQAAPSFAHYPLFPPQTRYKIAPEKLVLRHYPYRSREHASRKIANLLQKIEADPDELKSWQRRYLKIASEGRHILPADHRILTRYRNDARWNKARTHSPFSRVQPTRDELFTPDGYLKSRPSPTLEWQSDPG